MNNPLLTEATVQDIQLELISKTSIQPFDGAKISDSLLRHRELWTSVFMTTPQISVGDNKMPFLCLIPLRDLRGNRRNVDTMYLLCESATNAARVLDIARDEKWEFDSDEILETDDASKAIGMYPFDGAVLELWWD